MTKHGDVSVFLLDDHTVVREGVRAMLEEAQGFRVAGEAGTAREGLAGIEATRPDVVLVDARLPDGNGVDVIREVRSRRPETRCVIFTSFTDDEAFFQSVVAGASGYLVKDVGAAELTAAVSAVAGGASLIRREVIDDLRRRATTLPPEDELLAELTAQERRILGMVAEGWTNREIALRLSLAEKTVRNYVSNILAKVGMRNRTELATYVARTVARRREPVASFRR